ncbi:hypothetical protein Tco_0938485 [Tanacetum coccineum]|uniref:Uncharacterized protein n=1 Tax=Tanacetum coccineum TaxID=301880 RepID=A0ABQ5DHY5_9ASTR
MKKLPSRPPITIPINHPLCPFPPSLRSKKKMTMMNEFCLSSEKFISIYLFLEAMIHMPKDAKVLKDLLSHKEKLKKAASSVKLIEECLTVVQRSLPQKEGDLGSFILQCIIDPLTVKNALADLGANINLMSHSLFLQLGISKLKLTRISKNHRRIILNSVENGPLVWPTVEQKDDTIRLKIYEELSDKENLQDVYDLKATKIVLQSLPPDVYALVNHHKITKDIWDRVKLLMQGTSLPRQEYECKMYDKFDKFSCESLPPEWGKFMIDVRLARDLHTSNYDQHANEACLMRESFPNPLALVGNYHPQPSHFNN